MSLTVVALGGLCNRLRALLSSMSLAAHTACSIRVEWGRDAECRAWFEELFVPIVSSNMAVCHRPWWNVPARKRNAFLPAVIRKFAGYSLQFDCYVPNVDRPLPVERLAEGRNYLSTGSCFYAYPRHALDLLQPQPFIQQRIDRLCNQFVAHTVGVHIRRTDNVQSIANSPVEAFVRAVELEIQADAAVKFFLATDDVSLKQLFM